MCAILNYRYTYYGLGLMSSRSVSAVALYVRDHHGDSTYYIHTDHLGSYCVLTDAAKKVKQRNCFDPWGNFKWIYATGGREDGVEFEELDEEESTIDTLEMQNISAINFALTNRGFTGHEHYSYFKIINMNGRLYDPVIGRFFSPDKYVANGTFTQDFNRYSYARNCPLMYVDPSGEYTILVDLWGNTTIFFSNSMFFSDWNVVLPSDGPNIDRLSFSVPSEGTLYGAFLEPVTCISTATNSPIFPINSGIPSGVLGSSGLGFGMPPIGIQPGTPAKTPYTPHPSHFGHQISQVEMRNNNTFVLPKIPIKDEILKPLTIGATILDGLGKFSKPFKIEENGNVFYNNVNEMCFHLQDIDICIESSSRFPVGYTEIVFKNRFCLYVTDYISLEPIYKMNPDIKRERLLFFRPKVLRRKKFKMRQ